MPNFITYCKNIHITMNQKWEFPVLRSFKGFDMLSMNVAMNNPFDGVSIQEIMYLFYKVKDKYWDVRCGLFN